MSFFATKGKWKIDRWMEDPFISRTLQKRADKTGWQGFTLYYIPYTVISFINIDCQGLGRGRLQCWLAGWSLESQETHFCPFRLPCMMGRYDSSQSLINFSTRAAARQSVVVSMHLA